MRFRFHRRLLALLLAAALVCSLTPAAFAYQINPTGPQTMQLGDQKDFTFQDGGGPTATFVSWDVVVSNTDDTPSDIVSIQSGATNITVTVRADKPGTAMLRATYTVPGAGATPETRHEYKTITVQGSAPTVTSVTVTPSSRSLTVGQTFTPTATVTMSDGSTPPTVTWSSNANSVATVNASTGEITARGAGSAVITATAGGKTGSCTVTVTAAATVPVTKVTISGPSHQVTEGETLQLTATVEPANATDKTVTWSSSDQSVATVSPSGLVTGIKTGENIQIVATAGGVRSEYYNITVVSPPRDPSLKVEPTTLLMGVGEMETITAVLENVNTTNPRLTWTVKDPSVAYLVNGSSGARVSLRARAVGSTEVSVYNPASNLTAVCKVLVTATPPTGVEITTPPTKGTSIYVERTGAPRELKAQVYPDGADQTVTWSVADTSIATIDPSTGVITGVKPGKTVVTAAAAADPEKSDHSDIEVSGILLSEHELNLLVNRTESLSFPTYGNAPTSVKWTSSNPSIADASGGRITGHMPGTCTITATAGNYTDTCTVTVAEDVAESIDRTIDAGETLPFSDLTSDLDRRSRDKAGSYLDYIYGLRVATGEGTLFYGYVSPETPGHGVGSTERYYMNPGVDQRPIRDITFVPKAGFSGTAVIHYNGADSKGITFVGTIRVEVGSTGDVTYSTAINQPVTFSASDFIAICQTRNGRNLRYITFEQPSASRGTLYYDYSASQYSSKVDSATRYYPNSNPPIDKVTFLPAKDYTGTVDVTYHCTDTSGIPYTGSVRITVFSPTGGSGSDVECTTAVNQSADLSASSFNDACQHATNSNLNYIRFDRLPSSSVGTLYYNYTSSSTYGSRVSTSTRYYRNSTPRISYITFVPARGYSGTITVPFTGTSTSGRTFTGNLIIRVGDEYGTVNYSTPENETVTFRAEDFNSACQRNNGTTLNRISFSLPAASTGTLYYNYVSFSGTGTRVSASTSYYRTGTNSISNVTFVPASGYNGTVSIPFSGYDDSGARFSGTVSVTVGRGSDSRTVTYTTVTDGTVRFDAADFNNVCRDLTGSTLNYVRFDLPASRSGTLYYQYDSARKSGTKVTSSTSYYRTGSSRLINDVSFVASGSAGTVSFHYTGWAGNGDSFTGTVEITINSPTSNHIRYMGSSTPISLRISDFQAACQGALGSELSYIEFNSLPGSGHLYLGYTNPLRTGTAVTTGTRYYPNGSPEIGQIIYLAKAELQGLVSVSYTAYSVNGGSHTNTLEFTLSNSYCATPFSDVASGWDWAKPSIEFLRYSGITTGYSNNTFAPGRQISRGEFTLMVCRAFGFSTAGGASGFPDVPASSVYAGAIATARDLGIVQGENGLFRPTSPITRQSAMTMISRAMTAAGQTPPAASTALLSAYADGDQVSAHARSAVAALIQMGAVQGNASKRLNPTAAISRAEMAVILHRVLAR